jgi:uroporphyrinogen-III synthase
MHADSLSGEASRYGCGQPHAASRREAEKSKRREVVDIARNRVALTLPMASDTRHNLSSPLAGKRVVNTAAPHRAAELDEPLKARGAEPLSYPCVEIVLPQDTRPLDEALRDAAAGRYDWLLLTSTAAAYVVGQRLTDLGLGPLPPQLRVGATDARTAASAASEIGRNAAVLARNSLADALRQDVPPNGGLRVLLPQGDLARPLLARGLAQGSAHVAVVPAYSTRVGTSGVDLPLLLAERRVDAIALTSPASVRNLALRLEAEGAFKDALAGLPAACAGAATARSATELGAVALASRGRSPESVVQALERYFAAVDTESETRRDAE